MSVGLTMSRKKPADRKPEDRGVDAPAEKKKQDTANVKIHPEWRRRLKIIAAEYGLPMGALVQRELEEFMAREWLRLKDLKWDLNWRQLESP